MADMINEMAQEAVKAGQEIANPIAKELPQTALNEVTKDGFDLKSGVIGGVAGATLTAAAVAVAKRVASKPHDITQEIKNDPRVKAATEQKLVKRATKLEEELKKIYDQLDQLHSDDVIIEPVEAPVEE